MRKHLACKHETFAYDLLLQDSEPYMKVRYESEDIGYRPLPPIEVRERKRRRLWVEISVEIKIGVRKDIRTGRCKC